MKQSVKSKWTNLCKSIGILIVLLFFTSEIMAAPELPTKRDSTETGKFDNGASSSSDADAIEVKRLIDEDKDEEAKKLLDELLERDPESSALLYQLSRYYLGLGFIKDETIIGFHYKGDTTEKAIGILNEIIETNPSFGEAYPLLVLVYAVQNDLDKARTFLKHAKSLKPSPLWLPYNQALLHVKEKDYSKATKLMEPITRKRPESMNIDENRRYSAVWRLSRRLGADKPQYDPNDAIKNGLIKRVLAEQIMEYISNDSSDKPLFVHIASDDEWCSPCERNNSIVESLARKHGSVMEFVNVSFEPWENIGFQKDLFNKYAVRGVPTNLIFYQGKLISTYTSNLPENVAELFITDALETVKTGDIDRYTGADDLKSKNLLSFPFAFKVRVYNINHAHKALAVVFNEKGSWWSSWVALKKDQTTASEEALNNCNKTKDKMKFPQPCVLYAEGDKVVYKGTNEKVLKVLKNDFSKYKGRVEKRLAKVKKERGEKIQKVYKKYKRKKQFKAMAVAVNERGAWQAGIKHGLDSQEEAVTKAIEACEKYKKRYNIPDKCKLYAVGDENVYDKSASEISELIRNGPKLRE